MLRFIQTLDIGMAWISYLCRDNMRCIPRVELFDALLQCKSPLSLFILSHIDLTA